MAQRRKIDDVGSKGRADMSDAQGAPTLTAMGDMTGQFLQADFSQVVGGAKAGGSRHAGAPDGGSGGGDMPGSVPLLGHVFSEKHPKGRNPQRSAGRKTPAAKSMIRKGMD
jgi:hypothetical protein